MQRILLQVLVAVSILVCANVSAQEEMNMKVSSIDTSLIKNANAVVRSEKIVIEINSVSSMVIKTKRIVTVFNKSGKRYADSYEGYDPSTKIRKLEAVVYDASGKEIKKYKKKDFIDQSVYDGFSLARDDRVKYFNYTPTVYPYTLVFESEVEKSSTAFIRPWDPLIAYKLAVEKSSYAIINPNEIPFRIKEKNLENYDIEKKKTSQGLHFSLSDIPTRVSEKLGPSYSELVPKVFIALSDFSLEGIRGSIHDWESMGKWQYSNLISGRDRLPESTIQKVSELVADATTKKEKAKRIYEYVQGKTRYVSVQLGIGGWMPMPAADVDRLGYGDCKALTNYTKALLSSQDIESFYTVVYANKRRDIDAEFASMQGDHVILNIRDEEEDIWLECTSQTLPFNFIGDFTDNRDVLVVKPSGGEIRRTKKYEPEENLLTTESKIILNADKSMVAYIKRVSKGLQYDWHYTIQYQEPKDQKMYYKKHWNYINGLDVNGLKYSDDKDTVAFTEEINVSCNAFTKKAGNRLLLYPNAFNLDKVELPKYASRKNPLVIDRGYVHKDESILILPDGYIITTLPEKKSLESEFGTYTYALEKINESELKFTKFLKILDGVFPKEKYEEYRKFREEIRKIDQTRIVLKQV
ncbi:DUF3857 domain-containing protein [Aquimarina pacifica]|uniref:DUF3857 domain-containing protein n=1 Tax=Aquimarina pacifica TaxID=1296415 RepID=UPI000471BCD4|nr:DUF3857 domain-containing protein [Aquimarina pacifica]